MLDKSQFYKNRARGDGLDSYCKICKNKRSKSFHDSYKTENIMNLNRDFDKQCTKCGVSKHCTKFTKSIHSKDGFSSCCKFCRRKDKSEKQKCSEYYYKNREKIISQKNEYYKKRRKFDIKFKLLSNIRRRINHFINGKDKSLRSQELLGCSLEELKSHLESKFQDGMNWENYGLKGWHIDHINPCSSFSMEDLEEQKKCFHYSNLQPLWAIDNIKKGNS